MIIAIGALFQPANTFYTWTQLIGFGFLLVVGMLIGYQFVFGYIYTYYIKLSKEERDEFYNYIIKRLFNAFLEVEFYGLLLIVYNLFTLKTAIALAYIIAFLILMAITWFVGDRLLKS
jgi:hypothetical protein